jgi:predicted KAP-like P-loop ATPase
MVKGEINAVDFLAVTGLQVFLPNVYSGIRDNKNLFLRESKQHSDDDKRCDEIISGVDKDLQGGLKDFLKRLFPRLETVYGGTHYDDSWLDEWRKEGRVCSPDLFDIFFRLSLLKNEISQKEINRILSVVNDYETFSRELKNLNDQGKIVRFLERLEDYTEQEIHPEDFGVIIKALVNLGDAFSEGESGFFSIDSPMRILRLTRQMLRRLHDKSERYNILKTAFTDATDSLYTIVNEVSVQDQEHGRFDLAKKPSADKDFTLPDNLLDELEMIALQKIQIWAKDGRLIDHSYVEDILYRWSNWGNKHDTVEFVTRMIETDMGLVKYITAFVSRSMSQSMSDHVGKVQWRISLDGIKHFVADIQKINLRIRKIVQNNKTNEYSEKEQNAINLFLDAIDGKTTENNN